MIEVEGLTRFYGPKAAIEEVSFEVAKGEVVGFLGPNGAGKTTTMRILACFMPPTSGTARVAGFDIGKDSLEVRRRIGYLPESVPLYGDMTVRQYLTFAAEAKGVSRSERATRVTGVTERCLLADVLDRLIRNLSKGYRQRVGLAQALVGNPEVLILDEPTLGLDPKQIIEIRSLIRDMRGERTVILSTHILPEVSMVCQRVIILNEGRIVAVDTPENLNLRLQKSSRILLEVEGPEEEVRRTLAGVKGVLAVAPQEARDGRRRFLVETEREQDLRKDLARAVTSKGWGLTELRPVDLTLEDIFIRLVTREQEA
ncbi:MAG TPA: ATP-binding cassette domain-containing protein [Candidatus Methylomirabilis sp.]|jgi:ABC-2 type transport system ATP-binding protein|nr:ATP-binding cassette domain-containing protein [Candidatus Methylomirabilis sp.]